MNERTDLAAAMPTVALKLLGEPNKRLSSARESRYGTHGSLAVDLQKGAWFDHEAGVGGGVIDLIRRERKCSVGEALQFLENIGEMVTPVRALNDREYRSSSSLRDAALRIWRESVPAAGTLVDRYLQNRGLAGSAGYEALRFHPNCPFGKDDDGYQRYRPAMIGLMRSVVSGQPVGIHRTELSADARKVDRKMLGPAAGAAVMLTDEPPVDTALGVCEGIETGLAVMALGGGGVWALMSAGGIASLPVLGGVETLTIFADHDTAGTTAARECGERWFAAGIPTTIRKPPTPGHDFLDHMQAMRAETVNVA